MGDLHMAGEFFKVNEERRTLIGGDGRFDGKGGAGECGIGLKDQCANGRVGI